MDFISQLDTAITAEDASSSLSEADKVTAMDAWIRDAYGVACEYIRTTYSSSTTKGTIAVDGTISSSETGDVTDAFWGLDHLKADLREQVKKTTTLFPYHGYIKSDDSLSRYYVVTNGLIYRFEGINKKVYFTAAAEGLVSYSAAQYFTAYSETQHATNSTTSGNSAVGDYYNGNSN